MRSNCWIVPQWVGARSVKVLAAEAVETEEEKGVPSREELAAQARSEAGIAEFTISGSLRSAFYEAQKKDQSLVGHFRRPGDPFRVAGDGVLERSVVLNTGEKLWVVVIPEGLASVHGLSWRRACFDRAHHGALGGHKSAERTLSVLSRTVWWAGMKEDVSRWTEKCLTCLKARARPRKVTAGASKCMADACWQEVSVDCEGPNREDRWGFRYSLTYFDCLSHAVLI